MFHEKKALIACESDIDCVESLNEELTYAHWNHTEMHQQLVQTVRSCSTPIPKFVMQLFQ